MKLNTIFKTTFLCFGYFFLISFYSGILAQTKLIEETKIADDGLYFEGSKGKYYQFGKRITPHGTCMDVVNGYIYVSWWKGGMEKRNLMLSRKKEMGGEWKTIQFPDQHIGFRGDKTIGDSHNVAVVGVSTIDNTVHLLYDMHAYNKTSFPDHFFNYRVSAKGGAVVPDEQWNLELFSPRKDYLNSKEDYSSSTYPNFFRNDKGALYATWRLGGSGNGDTSFALYDGNSWSTTTQFNVGNQNTNQEKYSIYGDLNFMSGKLRAGFSVRYRDYETSKDYKHNSGLFYGYSNSNLGDKKWFNYKNEPINIPVQSPKVLQFAEPTTIGLGNDITTSPSWIVTKKESIHFISTVNGHNVHYYKKANDTSFSSSEIPFTGDLFEYKDKIYLTGLQDGIAFIYSVSEGTNDWKAEYVDKNGTKFRHGNAFMKDNKIFFFLMSAGKGSAQPLHLLTFEIK